MKILDKEQNRVSNTLLAVGFTDSSIRIFSLENENQFMQMSVQILISLPESIKEIDNNILVSQINGSLSLLTVDKQTGQLLDTRVLDFYKNQTVKLFKLTSQAESGILVCGKHQTFLHKDKGRINYTQLLLKEQQQISSVSSFNNKFGTNSLIYITNSNILKIVRKQDDNKIISKSLDLNIMGKKIIQNPGSSSLLLIQSESKRYNQ